jgi:hypothetical protein
VIDAAQVEQIADYYGKRRNDPAVLSQLRESFPAVHFTQCSDDDIARATPVLSGDGFNLYLMGGDHCLTLTTDFSGAKGVVLADVDDDEE